VKSISAGESQCGMVEENMQWGKSTVLVEVNTY